MSSFPSSSYGKILKATALLGGATVANVLLGIVRTKIFAVLLGPGGIGLIGVYQSIINVASTFAGLGLNRSGVRQIAESVGTGDQVKIATTVHALRKISLVVGAVGGLLLVLLSVPVSKATFGDSEHWKSVALLGGIVFFMTVSAGQEALVQGLRRLGDLARIRVLGSVWGTVFGIPIIWIWREQGIAVMLVVVAGLGLMTSWYYARQTEVAKATHDWIGAFVEAKSLVKLGVAFMAAGLMAAATVYLIRLIIIRHAGLVALGHYSAAHTLAGVYAGVILQAMGSDFYPRLTAVATDNHACNRLVNEQAEAALLMAGSGLVATLSLAPWVIQAFYSDQFGPSIEILRWQVLGLLGQLASWPMGFIVLAKGRGKIFCLAELVANTVHLLLVWVLVQKFGLKGAGMAFCGAYVFYWVFIYFIVRKLSGFSWSAANLRLMGWVGSCIGVVFVGAFVLPDPWSTVVGLAVTVLLSVFALRTLAARVDPAALAARWAWAKERLGISAKVIE